MLQSCKGGGKTKTRKEYQAQKAELGLLRRLNQTVWFCPIPKHSLKQEVESNYWRLKEGMWGREESRKLRAWRGEPATRAPNYKVFIAELLLCRQQECLHHESGSVSSNESHDSARASLRQSLSNFQQTPLQLLPLTPASLPLSFCCGEGCRPGSQRKNCPLVGVS